MNAIKQHLDAHKLSQDEFAKKLGVSQGMVWQWIVWIDTAGERGSRITAERAIEIETATGAEITRAQLRPDVFGKAA